MKPVAPSWFLAGRAPVSQVGFSLIEMMIAITISLLVIAALAVMFAQSSRSRTELEQANQQIENGRYALATLSDDLQTAGYFAEFDPDVLDMWEPSPPAPAYGKPNPCSTTLGSYRNPPADDDAPPIADTDIRASLRLHVQGYDNTAALTCISDRKANTDVIVVRRASTCIRGVAGCPDVAGAPYFQASTCAPLIGGEELSNADPTEWYRLDNTLGNLDRRRKVPGAGGGGCANFAPLRQYITRIYYVANNNATTGYTACVADPSGTSGDCVPTLKRVDLGAGMAFGAPVPIAAGIDDLQFEYGIDDGTGGTPQNDGAPDVFRANPDIHDAPGGPAGPFVDCAAHAAECLENWSNVMVVRVNLLARNTEVSHGHTDTKVYTLGLQADGTIQCAFDPDDNGVCDAIGDGFKRHVYQTDVRLTNPAGRRE